MTSAPRVRGNVFCANVIPSAIVRLPGPRHNSWSAGNGLPMSVLNPFLVLNFSVALNGLFPSRN